MPYLTCPSCALTIYSAAAYSTADDCPRCATPLRSVARVPPVEPPREPIADSEPGPAGTHDDVEISVDEGDDGTCVVVTGSLSYPLSARLEQALEPLDIARDQVLTIDLCGVSDIDSSGLAALLSAYLRARREGFDLVATRPPPRVRRIFTITGVERWLRIVDRVG